MIKSWFHRLWCWWLELAGRDRATIILELLGIAVVIAYTTVAALQWKQMRKATNSAKNAALAAVRQANTADEAMRFSQRPYIEIGRPDDKPIAEWVIERSGKKVGLRIYFQNAGSTPAQRFYVNGGRDPNGFLHLTLKPGPPKIVGGNFPLEIRAGETVGMDASGMWSWVAGIPIAARSTESVQASQLGEEQIAKAIKTGKGSMQVNGTFEYMDVFNEYCCETYVITWDQRSKSFTYRPGPPRQFYCPSDIPNVCQVKNEPILRPIVRNKK
jgi:hypothetical protein